MNNQSRNDWDPRDVSVLDNQRAAYDAERERCPVAHSDFLDWSLFRHQDIINVLEDLETYSSQTKRVQVPNGMDEPEHNRYRSALEPFFSPEWMSTLEPRCRRIASALFEAHASNDTMEFVNNFAQPFTLQTLCAFVGWPLENWEFLRGWTHGNQEAAFSQNREAGAALAHGYINYVQQGITERRQSESDGDYIQRDLDERRQSDGQDGDDLISQLMRTKVDGNPLTDEEIVSTTRNWTAGHGTVAATLGIIVHALAEDAELQARLRNDPSLIPAAIEEIPRTNGPLVANRRTTTRDVQIDGREIPSGDKLSLIWIAANRDPRAFDDPDEIRLERDQSKNLLYGHGIHYCVGAELARLELRIAVEELLKRTKTFTIATNASLSPQVYPSNGFQELPLRLSM